VRTLGLAGDLEAWRTAPTPDPLEMRALLVRLQAWKAQHDADRARQPGPFLLMAWDAVFGDDDLRVTAAIREIEAALGGARD
jgi:hypothetical protein